MVAAVAAVVCQRHFSPLARSSCSPTNALTPCPDPPRPISAIPDRSRPSAVPRNGAAMEQNGKKRPDRQTEQKALLWEAAERHQRQRRSMAGSVLARPAQGRFEAPLAGPARLLQRARVRSAWGTEGGGAGSRWGSCRPGAATAAARGARQDAQEGAVALGQGQEWAGMGRARAVCHLVGAGCAPPTLSASGLPLSDAAHTAGAISQACGKGVAWQGCGSGGAERTVVPPWSSGGSPSARAPTQSPLPRARVWGGVGRAGVRCKGGVVALGCAYLPVAPICAVFWALAPHRHPAGHHRAGRRQRNLGCYDAGSGAEPQHCSPAGKFFWGR